MSAAVPEEAVESLGEQATEQAVIVARYEARLRRAIHDGEHAARHLGNATERLLVLRRRHAEAKARLAAIDAAVGDVERARAASGPQRVELAALGPVGPEGRGTYFAVEDGAEHLVCRASLTDARLHSARALTAIAYLPKVGGVEAGMRRYFAIEHVHDGWFRVSERLAAFVLEVRHGHDVGWMMDRILGVQS